MLVFISWSGSRSKAVAFALKTWLRQVIQAADTWISADIEKGARWNDVLASKLEQSRVGIICLTNDNLDAKWILYEAGAISKMRDGHVCTFLLDVQHGDVEFPLAQFQHTNATREDVSTLLKTINKLVETPLSDGDLSELFEINWPRLQQQLDGARRIEAANGAPAEREAQDIQREMLELLRSQERVLSELPTIVETATARGVEVADRNARLVQALTRGSNISLSSIGIGRDPPKRSHNAVSSVRDRHSATKRIDDGFQELVESVDLMIKEREGSATGGGQIGTGESIYNSMVVRDAVAKNDWSEAVKRLLIRLQGLSEYRDRVPVTLILIGFLKDCIDAENLYLPEGRERLVTYLKQLGLPDAIDLSEAANTIAAVVSDCFV